MPLEKISSRRDIGGVLRRAGVGDGPVWIKVNWTSAGPGMFTEAEVLEEFLSVLPRPVMVAESYTPGRIRGSVDDLPDDEPAYMEAMRAADRRFLEQTKMTPVLEAAGVGYFNLSEAVWAGEVAPAESVRVAVEERLGPMTFPELCGLVPRALYDQRAHLTLINLARMKVPAADSGDWSLALKNMFGLIPTPDRRGYHRRGLAAAILVVNRIYRSLFRVVDVVEGISSVVVYDDDGPHRAPWGRYSLLEGQGLVAHGPDPVALELEIAAHFGRDLSGRTLIRGARDVFGGAGREC
ncbi:MAG: DUF362 domain-containing protein [Bacillota bacterium]